MSLAYHRLFRARSTYRWWKPLVAFVVGIGFYYALQIVYQWIVLLIVGSVGGAGARTELLKAWNHNQQDASNPLVMLFTLGSLATMLPSVIIAVRILGLGSFGTLASVRGRIRWRWLARCIVPGLVYLAVTFGLNYAVPASWQGESNSSGQATPLVPLLVSILLILLFVPLQSAGEEFAFRGFGMQTFGSWFRWPVVGIVVPTVGFAFAHNYNAWGKLDVAALGVSFAYLTWRTGGLEAGLVGHVLNNLLVFILAAPVVATSQSDGSPAGAAITVISSAAYVLMVTWVARKHEPERVSPVDNPGATSVVSPKLAE
ncbi:CAAX amino protease [Frondihabitans sucicola]|uniref:CAAX amino protease n=1 Tax=Frondihabitans sucicola TaxID=1268041 RepID=A0ABN6XXG6_9MICO|nr:type II CAAX endopeptidase family protein [Frondihabitans sucicola]BDZ48068.1 CAAX amino protease [Frondihabitans sucicola]